MKEEFIAKRFNDATTSVIIEANNIIEEYALQGYDLTLRQLYYQFVARALIPNTGKSYKRLGDIINNARLAGLVDWDAIKDRTRFLRSQPHWGSPADIVQACASQFRIDKWARQPFRLEVWIEKDALIGVVERSCNQHGIPFFACRGYVSQSFMYEAGKRLQRHAETSDQIPLIVHLGDHDPSGIDMTRDIEERLALFSGVSPEVRRVGLNIDQVRQYDPPPNPAKITDSRAKGYIREFGGESWELDALAPSVIADLIEGEIKKHRDEELWEDALREEKEGRARIQGVVDQLR